MASPSLLQLHIPLGELLGSQIKAIALVSNVMVLAKGATQVAARKEDASAPIVSLKTRLYNLSVPDSRSTCEITRRVQRTLPKVRGDCIDLYRLGTD
jgi:hypothetical protein